LSNFFYGQSSFVKDCLNFLFNFKDINKSISRRMPLSVAFWLSGYWCSTNHQPTVHYTQHLSSQSDKTLTECLACYKHCPLIISHVHVNKSVCIHDTSVWLIMHWSCHSHVNFCYQVSQTQLWWQCVSLWSRIGGTLTHTEDGRSASTLNVPGQCSLTQRT